MEIKVPELGENIAAADVTKVLVKAGDQVAAEQSIVELETGKATMEVPSPVAGKVAHVLVQAGDKVKIGQVLIALEGAGPQAEVSSKSSPQAVLATATAASPSPISQPPATMAAAARSPTSEAAVPAPQIAHPMPVGNKTPVAAAPSVRQFSRELGVDIHQVTGSEPGGRISIEDVKAHAKKLITTASAAVTRSASLDSLLPYIALPDFALWGAITREPMSTIRRVTAQHLAAAWATIPHVTQHDRAEITELEALRKRFAERAEKAGAKLTMTAILLKVVAAALKVFPKFNASLDMAKQEIVFKKYIHLGVAVDTERGLLVPVIRDVDKKNIIQLALEMSQLAGRARTGKIGPADLAGGTFTLTNLGGIGGSFFTPIINAPEVAVLGIGRAQMEPCIHGKDQFCAPRLMLPLSLSYDHRLIDGADGARFMRWIVEAIEEPLLISLEG